MAEQEDSAVMAVGGRLQPGSREMLDTSKPLKEEDNSDPSPSKRPAKALSIFMCKSCNSVLADGKSICAINSALKIIVFLQVTKHLVQSLSIEHSGSGELKDCAFSYSICLTCEAQVGLILSTASRPLTDLKDLYCLFTDQISCYLLETKSFVPADSLHFDFTDFRLILDQLQTDLVKTQNRIKSVRVKRQETQELPETHDTEMVK